MIRFKKRAGTQSLGPWWQNPQIIAAVVTAIATIAAALIYVRS